MRIDLGSGNIERITCVYIGRIGDVIVATPFLRALRRRFPKARIRLVVGARAAQVLPLIPFVDETAVLGRPAQVGAHLRLAWTLLREPCDLLIDLNSSFSKTSTIVARAARARIRLAFEKEKGPKVFNRAIAAPGDREHMSERYARLAEALGAPYGPDLELRVPPADDARAEALLAPLLREDPGAFRILVHPGNLSRLPSFWPEERLTELCRSLQDDPTLRLFFLAGPGERELVSRIAGALPRPAAVLPEAPLSVVGAMVKRMNLLLGSLTSTTHLAAALNVATFAFYEGYTQTVWRPRGARHGGTVSADWNHVQSTTTDEARAALKEHLARLSPWI
ncbi:MAG: glycosyltransferase family 9 protein [Elusimicrobia bacterium]|nr:glycosyltransferase family 9 protein [Elusimicrobiota bacterium]